MAKQEKSAAEEYRAKRKARLAKAAKRNKKRPVSPETSKRIARCIGVVAIVAIVAVIVAFVLNYTGIIQQNTTALTLADGTKISQSELGFYEMSTFNNRVMQYASYVGYDTTKTPDVQTYAADSMLGEIKGFPEGETPTWADYIEYSAKENIVLMKAAVAAAAELGVELDDSDYAEIDANIEQLKANAASSNYSLSAYLRASYGKGVTVKLFRSILEDQSLYSKLINVKTDEAKAAITEKQVEKAYNAATTTYGVVSYLHYTVTAEALPVEKEETSEDAQNTDAAAEETAETAPTAETLSAAKATADKIAASADRKEFLQNVKAAAKEAKVENFDVTTTISDNTSASDIQDSEFGEWAFGKDAVKGATHVTSSDTGYTVYMITEPVHKPDESLTYSVRHILVKFPEASSDEDGAAADDVTVTALDTSNAKDVAIALDATPENATDKATYQKAQNILQEYLNGEHTADAFGALAKKYTEDSNGEQGGLYEDVPLGQMVEPFESWAIADGRNEGDVGIVETTYGYHVMYFVGTTPIAWDDAIRADLVAEDINNYSVSLAESEAYAVAEVNEKAAAKCMDAILSSARNQIKNSANSAS